jgi:hypothetical protein
MTKIFDPKRDQWSIDATERLFPGIALSVFNTVPGNIVYAWHSDIDRLDTEYGTDAILKSKNRNIALAIRIRGIYYYQEFGDITIRYDSLKTLGKKLEMQKSIARFMFYGWGDTNSPGVPKRLIKAGKVNKNSIAPPSVLVDWKVVFLQRLIDVFLRGKLNYSGPYNNGDGSSRLVGITPSELESHKLIYKSKPLIIKEADFPEEHIDLIKEYEQKSMDFDLWKNEAHHAPYIYD